MIGTFVAIAIAIFMHFTAAGQESSPNAAMMGIVLVAAGTLFLFLPMIALVFAWSPLQYAEHQLTPRVTAMFQKDKSLWTAYAWLVLFPLITYIIAIDLLFLNNFNSKILLMVWVVLLGISLDVLRYNLKRISAYFDPFNVVKLFTHQAQLSIQNDREEDLCNWIDAASEVSMRSMHRSSTALALQVNDELLNTARLFLQSAKSISHPVQDPQSRAMGIHDKVSYTIFFLLQRLEMINSTAAERKLEPVCSNLVTVIGKIIVDAAKYDISIAGYPLHFLGKCAIKAQQKEIFEVGPKAILTLVGVAKTILTEIDVAYLELQDTFFTLINQMNEITKEMFRHDKTLGVKLLVQPFKDLRALFTTEKMAAHQDTPAILQQIDGVLAEYEALDSVLRSMPPITLAADSVEERG